MDGGDQAVDCEAQAHAGNVPRVGDARRSFWARPNSSAGLKRLCCRPLVRRFAP